MWVLKKALSLIIICSFVILISSQRTDETNSDIDDITTTQEDINDDAPTSTSASSRNMINASISQSIASSDLPILLDDSEKEDENRRWKTFLSWLIDNGTPLPPVTLAHFPQTGRGLACTTNLKDDEPALVIPYDVIMNSDRISHDTNLGNDLYQLDIDGAHLILSLYLLHEKHKRASFWKPYIDMLPKEYPYIPLYYSDDDLSHADGAILSKMRFMQQDLDDIKHAAKRLGSSFLSKYHRLASDEAGLKWAMVTVKSRNWGLNPDLPGSSLVPLADMLNHHPQLGKALRMQEDQYTITIDAGYDCKRGQELFDKYYENKKVNSDATYLLFYGFLMMNENEPNTLFESFMWSNASYHANIRKILKKKKCTQIDELFTTTMKKLPSLFFSCLQIVALEEHWDPNISLKNYLSYVEDSDPLIPYDIARTYFENVLKEYRTTIEEDTNILASSSLNYNARNLVRLRLGEKQALQHALDLVDERVQKLKQQ